MGGALALRILSPPLHKTSVSRCGVAVSGPKSGTARNSEKVFTVAAGLPRLPASPGDIGQGNCSGCKLLRHHEVHGHWKRVSLL